MKRIFLLVILGSLAAGFYTIQPNLFAQTEAIDAGTRQQILAATVQIKMVAPLIDAAGNPVVAERNGEWRVQNEVAHGLGTLVRDGDQVTIVTHDHWGDLLLTAETVEFRSATGVLLAEISGLFLRNLIRYRDQGTLLLQAPVELAPHYGQAVERGDSRQIGTGEQVFLTRHQPESTMVELVAAQVTAVTANSGVPVFDLRSLDGSVIVKGDSGGGIWSEGKLVGNMWRTVVHETVTVNGDTEIVEESQVTDNSIAAALDENIQDNANAAQVQAGGGVQQ